MATEDVVGGEDAPLFTLEPALVAAWALAAGERFAEHPTSEQADPDPAAVGREHLAARVADQHDAVVREPIEGAADRDGPGTTKQLRADPGLLGDEPVEQRAAGGVAVGRDAAGQDADGVAVEPGVDDRVAPGDPGEAQSLALGHGVALEVGPGGGEIPDGVHGLGRGAEVFAGHGRGRGQLGAGQARGVDDHVGDDGSVAGLELVTGRPSTRTPPRSSAPADAATVGAARRAGACRSRPRRDRG